MQSGKSLKGLKPEKKRAFYALKVETAPQLRVVPREGAVFLRLCRIDVAILHR